SGHSKWATIHRKKGLIDAERGKIFQKLAKEIYVVAKGTNGDPDSNPSLRMVIEKCRSQNMPKDNIQKAIDKAVGTAGGEDFESIRYEGYGPNGIAIMVDCLTDNRNRTASLVRSSFTKRGGNLGTDGSVSYLFERKGVIVIEKTLDEDDLMMTVLDNGASDMITNEDTFEIYTTPETFLKVKEAVEAMGVTDFITSEITYVASNLVEIEDEEAKEKVRALVETLEELDDVQDVYHNLSE
ncbi:MAG: YebC/PmpR family DNA-binding transcriptional regulator, partial [Bacilli bacterium]|nr:YebC/PmpR family DNA-binding transcriptional regulator [Bacilli bacterium]